MINSNKYDFFTKLDSECAEKLNNRYSHKDNPWKFDMNPELVILGPG